MDLLSIGQTIWRHKLATIPVLIVAFIGVVYVMKVKPPVYKTSANYILVNPPPAPTPEQMRADPALARINTNNPYLQWGSLSYVSSLLTQALTTDPILSQLVKEGVDSRFTIGPNTAYPLETPIVEITGFGSSASVALRSVELVGQEMTNELNKLQTAQGTDPRYFIKTQAIGSPGVPVQQLSSKLRTLVAVLALSVVALFVAVSVMTALDERRARRRQAAQSAVPVFEPEGANVANGAAQATWDRRVTHDTPAAWGRARMDNAGPVADSDSADDGNEVTSFRRAWVRSRTQDR